MDIVVTGPYTTGPKARPIAPPEFAYKTKAKWLSTHSVVVKAYQNQPDNYEQLVEHYITWEVTSA